MLTRKERSRFEELIRTIGTAESGSRSGGYSIYDPQYGRVDLLPAEVDEFEALAAQLFKKFSGDVITPRTIERWLERAVLEAVNPTLREPEQFESRLATALIELGERFSEKPRLYEVYYPVEGLDAEALPFDFGKQIKFLVLDASVREEFEQIAMSIPDEWRREYEQQEIKRIWEFAGEGQTYARTIVFAIDDESARHLALTELTAALDIINFLGNFVPFNLGIVSLPGRHGSAQVVSPLVRREPRSSLGVNYTTIPPYGLFDLRMLESSENAVLYKRVVALLDAPRTKLADALLASIQWIGRATVERRTEQAFLLYAIALESLLLSDNNPEELTYRLRLRLAHLLGESYERRHKLYDSVSRLYRIRSEIVHSGRSEVTMAQLNEVRTHALKAVAIVLVDPIFAESQTPDDLRHWFDRRILGEESASELPPINQTLKSHDVSRTPLSSDG
jgi:hypothetical protein